jgi:hypothetical protein
MGWLARVTAIVALAATVVALLSPGPKALLRWARRRDVEKCRKRLDSALDLLALTRRNDERLGMPMPPRDLTDQLEVVEFGRRRRVLVRWWDGGRLYARLARNTTTRTASSSTPRPRPASIRACVIARSTPRRERGQGAGGPRCPPDDGCIWSRDERGAD